MQRAVSVLPEGTQLSRGAKRDVEKAVKSGLATERIEETLISAAAQAALGGKSKLGVFGPSTGVFRELEAATRLEPINRAMFGGK
ncbi:MAG TPA: hypothetical protein VE090_00640 [Methylomirabilota bacterium]|nr:hypothetical protein [Methylomirabilota bacterium]